MYNDSEDFYQEYNELPTDEMEQNWREANDYVNEGNDGMTQEEFDDAVIELHAAYDDEFQDPDGNSSLRRASASNPRNLPCPTCGAANRLTPKDKECGYQCNSCADRDERGF